AVCAKAGPKAIIETPQNAAEPNFFMLTPPDAPIRDISRNRLVRFGIRSPPAPCEALFNEEMTYHQLCFAPVIETNSSLSVRSAEGGWRRHGFSGRSFNLTFLHRRIG
ncbi:hypothetical protein, partial [Sphingomonas bacterium]|uniref:hypothetical protein n=1 Tax=Sphingomonas bacterium TaxID=1895847 RepID=UPI001C2D6664